MRKSLTPSATNITDNQIGKIQELIGAALRKKRSEYTKVQIQRSLSDRKASGKLISDFLSSLDGIVHGKAVKTYQYFVKNQGWIEDEDVSMEMKEEFGEDVEIISWRIIRDLRWDALIPGSSDPRPQNELTVRVKYRA